MANDFVDESIKIRIFNQRRMGISYKEIAEELNLHTSQVHKIVKVALEELKHYRLDLGKTIIDQELTILDDLLKAKLPDAKTGDDKAIETVLKILQRRTKYLGLDEVERIDLSGNVELGEAILRGFQTSKKTD